MKEGEESVIGSDVAIVEFPHKYMDSCFGSGKVHREHLEGAPDEDSTTDLPVLLKNVTYCT